MMVNKKYLGIAFIVILFAFIANYAFQNSFSKQKDNRRQRHSMYFGKNELMKNVILARKKDPKFLEVISKKIKENTLRGREAMIYAEALALYDTKTSTTLMYKLFQSEDPKVHTRVLKGLAEREGELNKKLLLKIFHERNKMADIEKIYLYMAMYTQFPTDRYRNESIKYLTPFLNLNKKIGNLLVLRFFYEKKIFTHGVLDFSKQIVNAVFEGQRISPVLLSFSVKVLITKEPKYISTNHKRFMSISNPLYVRYYIPTLRLSCIPDIVTELLLRLEDKNLIFDLFRPLAAELKVFGGDIVYNGFEKLLNNKDLAENKKAYLKQIMKSFHHGKQLICLDK